MGTTRPESEHFEFDVAVSFAGEDRGYVEDVVAPLKAAGVRVFYDSDYLAETWGENLVEYFDGVYRKRSRFAILFVSRHYASKMWPRLERRSALARAMEQRATYILPIRLDDSVIDGLLPTVGVVDARRLGIDKIIEAALSKLSGQSVIDPIAVTRAPRTEPEKQLLLIDRPGGWEYLLFASELLRLRDTEEVKFRNHTLGMAAASTVTIRDQDMPFFLQTSSAQAERLSNALGRAMSQAAQERAFGVPGEAGDAAWIEHLASSWNGVYAGFLDWAAGLRGTRVSSVWHDALDTLAHYADQPVSAYRAFVDDFAARVDDLPRALANHEKVALNLTLTLTIPDDATRAFRAALTRAKDELGW